MSEIKAEVIKIAEVNPHPNADRLEIVRVKGWTCVVGRGEFVTGQKAIYVPVDAFIPPEYEKTFGYSGRVKVVRLRKIYSHGILIPCPNEYDIGSDVSDMYNITKYEAPEKLNLRGLYIKKPTEWRRYSIEKYNEFTNKLGAGMDVEITEKINGTHFTCMNIGGVFSVLSRQENRKRTEDDVYWKAADRYNLENLLPEGFILECELFGPSTNKSYGRTSDELAILDIREGDKYLEREEVYEIGKILNLVNLPIIYRGKWSEDLIKYSNGNSILGPGKREGIVIRVVPELHDDELGRMILKLVDPGYEMKYDDGSG